MFRDKFSKMKREEIEEEIRKFKDFSKWTREEMEEELSFLLPDIKLDEFSDQELEDLLREHYTFSKYSEEELREEARRHERYKNLSREDLEKRYDEYRPKRYKTAIWIIIAILSIVWAYQIGVVKTQMYYVEKMTEIFMSAEHESEEQEKDILEEKVDNLADIIDLIIIYISDNVPAEENPETPTERI